MSITRYIEENPGATISEIARATGVSKATVSRIVGRLEENGAVVTRLVGRNKHVYPSKKTGKPRSIVVGIIKATEYLFLPFIVKHLKNIGFNVELRVYREGLTLTRHLSQGLVDLAYSPLLTQLLYYPFNPSYKIVYGGVYGGAGIVRSPGGEEGGTAASTPISTMESCIRLYDKRAQVIYMYSGDEILGALRRRSVELAAVWEPYLSKAREAGFKVDVTCDELLSPYCCTLGVSDSVLPLLGNRLIPLLEEVFKEYKRNPLRMASWYARITRIPMPLIKKALPSYKIAGEVDGNTVSKLLNRLEIRIPGPGLLLEALNKD